MRGPDSNSKNWCFKESLRLRGVDLCLPMAASRGGMGGSKCPQSETLPPTCPPQSEEKNGQNQPFLANFWIFAPSKLHFAPSMPPTKKFLVPPLELYWSFPSHFPIHWKHTQTYWVQWYILKILYTFFAGNTKQSMVQLQIRLRVYVCYKPFQHNRSITKALET